MKKICSILLVLTLVLASCSVAFADTTETFKSYGNDANFTGDSVTTEGKVVTVKVNGVTGGGEIYKVEVAWGSLDFEYNLGSENTWDPVSHTNVGAAGPSWTNDNQSATITITNHSNAAVNAEAYFGTSGTLTSSANGFTATLTDAASSSIEADSAEKYAASNCPKKVVTVTVDLDTDDNTTVTQGNFEIGTITVKISK